MSSENKPKLALAIYNGARSIITRFSPELTSKITYEVSWKRKLDLKDPKDFNQKIMWLKLKLYGKDPVVTQCVDKYGVRAYVEDHGCGETLNELIGVWNTVEDIPWESLPNQFALKLTHSCAANIICKDKSKLDIDWAKKQLKKWYKEDYYLTCAEMQYKNVPKRIICEKYIDSFASAPTDYKFYCYYGKPEMVLVVADRGEHTRKHFYDMNWNFISSRGDAGELIEKPESLNEMIECCKKLASQFPFVRMDFYEVNGRAMFGEMTFTPAGGIGKSYSPEVYKKLGDLLVLPQIK